MSQLLWTNNARTTLAGPITNTATSLTLATGTGALFPNPSAGQSFLMTLLDAATQTTTEIVLCTARSGDVCTVARAQEGTTAIAWSAGDKIANIVTAGALSQLSSGELIGTQLFGVPGTYTYTPTVGTARVEVEVVGAGGGGAGCSGTSSSTVASVGTGGGGGGYSRKLISSGFSGVTITVGSGGSGGAASSAGGTGGTSSFGSILTATGGTGGQFAGNYSTLLAPPVNAGGSGGIAFGGDINIPGETALRFSGAYFAANFAIGGEGADSQYGVGGKNLTGGAGTGSAGGGFGAGGAGGSSTGVSGPSNTGGAGASGLVIVREYR